MKQEKLFTVAGTSKLNGLFKVRFGNDLVARIKVLHSRGNTDVNLIELPSPMTKRNMTTYITTSTPRIPRHTYYRDDARRSGSSSSPTSRESCPSLVVAPCPNLPPPHREAAEGAGQPP